MKVIGILNDKLINFCPVKFNNFKIHSLLSPDATIKFIYFEKVTKFEEISNLPLSCDASNFCDLLRKHRLYQSDLAKFL